MQKDLNQPCAKNVSAIVSSERQPGITVIENALSFGDIPA